MIKKILLLLIICALLPVYIHGQQGIPVLEITMSDSLSKVERNRWTESVTFTLTDNDKVLLSCMSSIKGRGHSTWTKRKKPYAFRLEKPESVLGMRRHRNWALLANVMDHSHMRNHLALEIARKTSLRWTPQGRFVRFRADGRDMGLYYLCENVALDKARLDAPTLIEYDSYQNDTTGIPLDKYGELRLDTLSLIDWLLVHELTMNAEPNGPRSTYLHITPDNVLHSGPAWDYDLAFNEMGISSDGNIRPMRLKGKMDSVRWLTVDSIYNERTPLFEYLKDYGISLSYESLWERMRVRWRQLVPGFRELVGMIDDVDRIIREIAENDQRQWNDADPARFDPSDSYIQSYSRLRAIYLRRLEVMDGWFSHPYQRQ